NGPAWRRRDQVQSSYSVNGTLVGGISPALGAAVRALPSHAGGPAPGNLAASQAPKASAPAPKGLLRALGAAVRTLPSHAGGPAPGNLAASQAPKAFGKPLGATTAGLGRRGKSPWRPGAQVATGGRGCRRSYGLSFITNGR
ncbi:MAG: hypothetical protein JXC32_06360, partial [Anaerolineae bacterium]|nr:hypothetical protein [Anaerolineae bacterium]